MAFTPVNPTLGFMPIANVDAGYTPVNGASVLPTEPAKLGTIVRAVDPTYGEGEFILLKGVASTVVGSLVKYNAVDFQTTLVTAVASQDVPVAVAMSANGAGTFGWYQISGTASLAKTAVIVLPNVPVFISGTAGKVKAVASAGLQVVNCRSQLVTTASAAATVLVSINRVSTQSQII